jgi:hypothetical protein
VLQSARPEATAQASCANVALRGAGGAAGVAGLIAVLLASGSYASGGAYTDGLVRALWVAAAVVAGGAVVSLLIPGRQRAAEVVATVVDTPAARTVDAAAGPAGEPETLPDVHVDNEDRQADAFRCPVCQGHGWFAFQPPADPRTQTCQLCYGHGQVLTGSHVPAHMTRACPDCEGRGYVEVAPQIVESAVAPAEIEPASEPEAAISPTIETNLPAAEFPRTTSGWDELRGRPRDEHLADA